MNGKSEDRKADKAADKEERREGRERDKESRSDYREKNREERERQSGGGGGEFRQQQSEPNREPGADPSDYAAAQRDQETGVSDYMQQQEAARQAAAAAEAAKKSGCLPKLAMLLLPFAALGTYFFLRS